MSAGAAAARVHARDLAEVDAETDRIVGAQRTLQDSIEDVTRDLFAAKPISLDEIRRASRKEGGDLPGAIAILREREDVHEALAGHASPETCLVRMADRVVKLANEAAQKVNEAEEATALEADSIRGQIERFVRTLEEREKAAALEHKRRTQELERCQELYARDPIDAKKIKLRDARDATEEAHARWRVLARDASKARSKLARRRARVNEFVRLAEQAGHDYFGEKIGPLEARITELAEELAGLVQQANVLARQSDDLNDQRAAVAAELGLPTTIGDRRPFSVPARLGAAVFDGLRRATPAALGVWDQLNPADTARNVAFYGRR
jgi:hypothetical protein